MVTFRELIHGYHKISVAGSDEARLDFDLFAERSTVNFLAFATSGRIKPTLHPRYHYEGLRRMLQHFLYCVKSSKYGIYLIYITRFNTNV